MATIRKREWSTAKGEHKAAWLVDYKDSAGKRRFKQFDRKKDAEAWKTKATYDVTQGTHTPDAETVTVAKAGELWLDYCRGENLELTTIASYDQHVRLHIKPLIGTKKLNQLTRPAIEAFRDDLVKTMSRAMARKVLRSLTMLLGNAQRLGKVSHNAARGVTIKRGKREKPQIVIPQKAEVRAFLEAAKRSERPMDAPLAHLLVFTGLRASELRGLPWSAVDLKAATVTVSQRADRQNNIGPPKSEAGIRTIPLPPLVVRLMKEWKLRCPKTDLDLVFPSEAGTPIFHANLVAWFLEPLLHAAGLTQPSLYKRGKRAGEPILDDEGNPTTEGRYGLHDFRHCAASLWIEHRVDAKRIQTWIGHSTIQLTFDTYGHLFKEAEADAAIALAIQNALLGEADGTQVQHG